MDNLTEKQWKYIIKREGCAFKELYKVRGEYANIPLYMRFYISLLAKQEIFDNIKKVNIAHRFLDEYNPYYQKIKQRHLSTSKQEIKSFFDRLECSIKTDRTVNKIMKKVRNNSG